LQFLFSFFHNLFKGLLRCLNPAKYQNGDKNYKRFQNPDFETAYEKSRIGAPQPNEGLSAKFGLFETV